MASIVAKTDNMTLIKFFFKISKFIVDIFRNVVDEITKKVTTQKVLSTAIEV
jgi:hypothetical protein